MVAARPLLIILLMFAAALAANALWQRIHCHEPWAQVDPLQMIPCEPVEEIADEMACLRALAEQYPNGEPPWNRSAQ